MSHSVAIVGSTGSIGTQALDVVEATGERFEVTAIGSNSSVELLGEQARRFRPRVVGLADPARASELEPLLPGGTELRVGPDALASLVDEAQTTVNGVVGFAGLSVTLTALSHGRRLALANKESLIAAGPLVQAVRHTPGAELLPVDSEHGAIHQCLRSESDSGAADYRAVSRLILTASGGPFRGRTTAELAQVTVDEALHHPTWSMGPKITIDSSTLFNKGLEVIEAHELFGTDYDDIDVTVHPQSILHSAVEFTDGSTIGQLSRPDMRLPIGYAMGHPERLDVPYGRIDWATLGTLTFEAPDRQTFRCLDLAYAAGRAGGLTPTWLNAANEVAVAAFLLRKVTWLQISSIIEQALEQASAGVPTSVEEVVAADREARSVARRVVEQYAENA